jgi:predicted TIM-barrel fold metal-dependent hydrolase
VYVDVAFINSFIPRAEFHAYLRRLVDAGFARNIMHGSDQVVWPQVIPRTIEAIESAEFLSAVQKRDILCANAARFFRLRAALCG